MQCFNREMLVGNCWTSPQVCLHTGPTQQGVRWFTFFIGTAFYVHQKGETRDFARMNVVETPEPLLDYSRDDSLLIIETFLPVILSCICRLRLEQRLWVLCSTLLGARHRRQQRPGLPRESRQALRSSTSLLDTTSVSRTIYIEIQSALQSKICGIWFDFNCLTRASRQDTGVVFFSIELSFAACWHKLYTQHCKNDVTDVIFVPF